MSGRASVCDHGPCQNCGEHPGTQKWTEGAIAMIHGAYFWWCEGCVLRAQIAHAEERVVALDDLRARLADWEAHHA